MLTQRRKDDTPTTPETIIKPLLRGWFHAGAAFASVVLLIALCWHCWADLPRLVSLAIYGLSMIELYSISALYHIVRWHEPVHSRLRAIDHANIFVLIAGTYTPLCFNVLSGWLRPTILIIIWVLAIAGVGFAMPSLRIPRWVTSVLYVGMGWVVVLALPAFVQALSWFPTSLLLLGGIFYTIGAIIYALRFPNPFPRVLGFHEIFHLFVIAGSVAFAAVIWFWVVPFVRL